MSLYIASLNSGSNGNCYYVGNNEDAVLIDAGISCKEIELRLRHLQLSMANIKAVFISHEHNDHIKGVAMLSRKHQVPVYITDATRRHGHVKLEKHLSCTFHASMPVSIGSLQVSAFNKMHDAVDPYSFMVSSNGVNVGVFTDIGTPCANLVHHFKQCHAAFLESNYDEEMLANGPYPYILKKRITGGNGHLSNRQALELFLQHRSPALQHLLLAHLSKNNNRPEIVASMFGAHAGNVQMTVASRFEASPLFHVQQGTSGIVHQPKARPAQMVLDF